MKITKRMILCAVFPALFGLWFSGCGSSPVLATSRLSGTYVADTSEINTSFTFSGSNLTVQVDDRIGPGTYSISGDILSLNISGLTETFIFTIVDQYTLKASSGIYWRKR